ncbi:MAG: hypothetical protein IPK27_20095 [Rhodanobacteraceae bacterium]|nr:hypothetical protein [Rhodanobacteraceae bacterium]
MEMQTDIVGYRFGRVELDLARGCLRVDGSDVSATGARPDVGLGPPTAR